MKAKSSVGLHLTGGGSRGAYQVGVLLGLAEAMEKVQPGARQLIFNNVSGVSAGAINAAYLASAAADFQSGMKGLRHLWDGLQPKQVYRTDLLSLGGNAARWIGDLTLGSMTKTKMAKYLLDTAPLRNLIAKGVPFSNISQNLAAGAFDGIVCSAYSYFDHRMLSFIQSKEPVSWNKPRRYSLQTVLDIDHVYASCAIPLVFPSVHLNGQHFGDGTFRNTTPLAPLIHMGSRKILVIGVRGPNEFGAAHKSPGEPNVSRVAGLILHALFFDTVDLDVERIHHLNEILEVQRGKLETRRSDYQTIQIKQINPSEDITEIARNSTKASLPKTIEFMLGGLGNREQTAELASYILFDSHFTRKLIEVGYKDIQNKKDEIVDFLLAE